MQQVEPAQLEYSGGGFRDFTRIAGANPQLWWRILSMNKTEVLAALDAYQANLAALRDALDKDDADTGVALLQAAAQLRQALDR